MPLSYSAAEIFAKALRDDTVALNETAWSDFSALGYAKSARTGTVANRWFPQPMPAVDGFNAKIDGYGGGANHTSSLYGADGSVSIPLAQQWGLQLDGGVGSFNSSGTARGAGHVFWRDPSVGLVGAYGSYSRWNGLAGVILPRTALSVGRYAAEGELYWGRLTLGGIVGYENVSFNMPAVVPGAPAFSIPNRFFDAIRASYYVTDDFKLSLGHVYTIGRNALTLGGKYGFSLGGGRMASLFAEGAIAGGGTNLVRGGLRIYFGQHEKTLIDRNRQDDPDGYYALDAWAMNVADVLGIRSLEESSGLPPRNFLSITPATTTPSPTTPGTTTTTGSLTSFTSFTTP
jgi:hypothetical protein